MRRLRPRVSESLPLIDAGLRTMNTDFIQQVVEALEHGEVVRRELPEGGYLHIDHALPFLCVHRRRAGQVAADTEALLTSQAAYLLAPAEASEGWLTSLVVAIARQQARTFGAFLLLELWNSVPDTTTLPPHAFRIVAPSSQPPGQLLEVMEDALLAVTIHRKVPTIHTDYSGAVAPPGLPPLLEPEWQHPFRITSLGLEINPVYRDPATGKTFSFAHKAFRQRMNKALKRSFYAFALHYTTHHPAHYHELGQHIITAEVRQVDRALARISSGFDLLLHVTPVNAEQAWQAFMQHGYARDVEFHYRPRTIEPDLLKRRLFRIPIEKIDDPTLADIFAAKRDELDRHITLVADRNTPRFLLGSRQLFGDVSPDILQLARDILDKTRVASDSIDAPDMLDAEQLATMARRELRHYRQQDKRLRAKVVVREDIAGIMVSHGNFLIGSATRIPASRLPAALAHEIGTHVLTYHNGRQQPFQELYTGMAGYEPLQEGLAVLAEYLVGGLNLARLRQLAGRVLAVQSITGGAGFVDTFRLLHQEHGFAAKSAFMMTMRTFRGGGYTKDAIYLQGLVGLLECLARGQPLATLYLGKVSQAYLPLVEELRWRKILQPPRLLPRLFETPASQPRLQRLAQGITVLDMVEELIR